MVAVGDTVILGVVSLVGDHLTVPEQLAIDNVADSPEHSVVLVALMLGDGGGITTIIADTLLISLVQPVVLSLQVAVYEVFEIGDTVSVFPVAPVLHVTVPEQPVAVIVVLVPEHIVEAAGEMVGGVGFGLTVITT